MTNAKQTLTAAHIKYLLALYELSQNKNGIRCIDVAQTLGISKPSVHTMMNILKTMELIRKDPYGRAYFTQDGEALAEIYSKYFQIVCGYFAPLLPEKGEVRAAACALLAEVSSDSLDTMCERMIRLQPEEKNVSTKK